MLSKKILKKIPIIKRVYPSLMKIFYKNKKIKFKFFGLNLEGNFSEPMDKEIFLFNNYENLQIEFLINNIKKYNLKYFIDIGANSGIYSLIVSDKFHKIKIKSFEPIKKTIVKFRDNLRLNKKLKNIKLYEFGLSNKNTKLLMRAKIRDGYIQSSGYGVVKKEDNLKNLHTENNIFKVGDSIIKISLYRENTSDVITKEFNAEQLINFEKGVYVDEIFPDQSNINDNEVGQLWAQASSYGGHQSFTTIEAKNGSASIEHNY